MSSMLEEAILDAAALRKAALENAEATIIEKYSVEVKDTMTQILEQDPMDLEDPLATDEEDDPSEIVADIPMAHDDEAKGDSEDVVVIDLDQIISAAEEEPEEDFEMSTQEIADNVGIDLDPDTPEMTEPPANRSDDDDDDDGSDDDTDEIDEDLDLDESELVDIFKEMLVVDLDPKELEHMEEDAENSKKEEEEEVVVFSPATDGMDKKDIEDHKTELTRLQAEAKELSQENKDLKFIITKAKDRLEEINLSNARLLYANRVFQDPSLNEQQKNKIAEMISESRSVDEAKTVYETLQKTMAGKSTSAPKSLSEAVSRRSSVVLSGRRKEEATENSPVKNRWATLAGINKK
jgi:hypothetical protein